MHNGALACGDSGGKTPSPALIRQLANTDMEATDNSLSFNLCQLNNVHVLLEWRRMEAH